MSKPYTVEGSTDIRLVTLLHSASHRYKFYSFDTSQRIKFKKNGARLYALVQGKVVVKKTPHTNHFNFALMQANRGALSRGEKGADSERILENMLECVEVI
jgi:hypothetical protein